MKRYLCLCVSILGVLLCFEESLSAQQAKPQLFGLVKARYETNTVNGENRFSVRNARLGAKGFISSDMSYNVLMEVNAQGNFSVLDTYAAYNFTLNTVNEFNLILGQQAMFFTTEVHRGASLNYFANRSFMGKFLDRYVGINSDGDRVIGNIGSRDVGAVVQYNNKALNRILRQSILFSFGVFNGTTPARMEWGRSMNLNARIATSNKQGLGFAASWLGGKTPLGDNMHIWGVEARYIRESVIIESEFAQRYLYIDGGRDLVTTSTLYGMYIFRLSNTQFAKSIAPQIRWDWGDNMLFANNLTGAPDSFRGHRLTAGIAIITGRSWNKLLNSEIRLNYEHFMPGSKPSDYSVNSLLHNKFTIEFFTVF